MLFCGANNESNFSSNRAANLHKHYLKTSPLAQKQPQAAKCIIN
ncbi:hypothetical protein CAMSH0001_0486 [Campylobacter showae RM3277]|uniref:Uncharacterized protein n=1 Tax=Campylobacter showae RM3277 TaxID=553219 RepID=C6RFI1_9BACT|nr:hypothetical protein CAMSH0001_0486 [Campylobacter showae RM3277]